MYQSQERTRTQLGMLNHLCCNILLGIHFQAQHSSVVCGYGDNKTTSTVCEFTTFRTKSPTRFKSLTADCHPSCGCAISEIFPRRSCVYQRRSETITERRYNRTQPIAVACQSGGRERRKLEKTFGNRLLFANNRFAFLDACPLPNINELVIQPKSSIPHFQHSRIQKRLARNTFARKG